MKIHEGSRWGRGHVIGMTARTGRVARTSVCWPAETKRPQCSAPSGRAADAAGQPPLVCRGGATGPCPDGTRQGSVSRCALGGLPTNGRGARSWAFGVRLSGSALGQRHCGALPVSGYPRPFAGTCGPGLGLVGLAPFGTGLRSGLSLEEKAFRDGWRSAFGRIRLAADRALLAALPEPPRRARLRGLRPPGDDPFRRACPRRSGRAGL